MLPILLCMAGWLWSVSQDGSILYFNHGRSVRCDSLWGVIGIRWSTNNLTSYGWEKDVIPEEAHFWPGRNPDSQSFLGLDFRYFQFGTGHSQFGTGDLYVLDVPYWLLIVVFSTVLFFVWRKTRPKPNPKTAFPVEVLALK